MNIPKKKLQNIFKNFSKTLEERDREDRDLFGWKGGQVIPHRSQLDSDNYAEGENDSQEE